MISVILFIIIFALSLLQIGVLHSGVVFSILALLTSAAGIVLAILKKRLWQKKVFITAISVLLFLISVAALALSSIRKEYTGDYQEQMAEATEYLEKGKYEKAMRVLEDIEDDYGVTNQTQMLRVLELAADEGMEAAYAAMEEMPDHTPDYYLLMELLLRIDPEEEADECLAQMYVDAAFDWPEWTRMQKMAGMVQLMNNRTDQAEYYFTRALLQDHNDGEIYYYLGVVGYQRNDIDTMALYFSKALDLGISDTRKGEIKWYLEQRGEE